MKNFQKSLLNFYCKKQICYFYDKNLGEKYSNILRDYLDKTGKNFNAINEFNDLTKLKNLIQNFDGYLFSNPLFIFENKKYDSSLITLKIMKILENNKIDLNLDFHIRIYRFFLIYEKIQEINNVTKIVENYFETNIKKLNFTTITDFLWLSFLNKTNRNSNFNKLLKEKFLNELNNNKNLYTDLPIRQKSIITQILINLSLTNIISQNHQELIIIQDFSLKFYDYIRRRYGKIWNLAPEHTSKFEEFNFFGIRTKDENFFYDFCDFRTNQSDILIYKKIKLGFMEEKLGKKTVMFLGNIEKDKIEGLENIKLN